MRIAYIGKFEKMHDEEYIARSFEMLGHTVTRIPERALTHTILGLIDEAAAEVVFCTKLFIVEPDKVLAGLRKRGIPSVSWTWDLYWDYAREERIPKTPGFRCDYVFTSDGGHDDRWKDAGIRHEVVRQGIYKPECYLAPPPLTEIGRDVVFIGSINPLFPYRQKTNQILKSLYNFSWYGADDTNDIRGTDLNDLFARTKIVVGDSVPSPYYWSNRVVETLGRGGFLIHAEVPGIKEVFPDLVTYKTGDYAGLRKLIDYFLRHEDERKKIVQRNYQLVLEQYTMDKMCAKLLAKLPI